MPAKSNLSFSTRWNLARSRRDDFPASPDFSKLESGRGVNLVRTFSRTLAQFNRAVRHRPLRRQKTDALDSNFQHGSLQLTAKPRSVPALNRLAACPQNSRTSQVRGGVSVQTRIRFHVARIPGALDRFYQRHDAASIHRFAHFRTSSFREYRTPLVTMLDWPKTTSHA
jgi:hypothetical protein